MSLPICSPRVLMSVSSTITQDGRQLLRRKAEGVVGGEVDRRDEPGRGRNRRHQDAQIAGERDGHGRDGAGLDDQESVQP